MNSLNSFIEKYDPGHFENRKLSLEKLSEKVSELGFFPLPITQNDVYCFWIRVEGNDSRVLNVSFDLMYMTGFVDTLKKVAKYETR